MHEDFKTGGKSYGKTAATLEWLVSQTEPVTVVTSSESQAEWWRDRLARTPHSVIVDDGRAPERLLRPVSGATLFFDLWEQEADVIDLDSRR